MEPDPRTAIAMHEPQPPKKRRSVPFIRALLLLINGRSSKASKSMQVEAVASSELLNRVVGTMRPLHAAQNCSVSPSDTPRVSLPVLTLPENCVNLNGKFEEGAECLSPGTVSMKPSSSCSSFLTVSEGGNTPEYGSPLNHLESENSVDEFGDGDRDRGAVEDGGDEMIDVKAEEFIARFYEQVRIHS